MENGEQEKALIDSLKELISKNSYPPVMDMEEAAEYLKINYFSLAKEARMGLIKSKKFGRRRKFRKEWLDEWMERT